MYLIIVYDVSQRRVNQFCKFLKRYLNWVQNSVFEGEVNVAQYELIKHKLTQMVGKDDCVIIYDMGKCWKKRMVIGNEKNQISNVV